MTEDSKLLNVLSLHFKGLSDKSLEIRIETKIHVLTWPQTPLVWSAFGAQYILCLRTPSKSHATPLNPFIYLFEGVSPRLEPTVYLIYVMIGQCQDSAMTSNDSQCSPNNIGCSGFFSPRYLLNQTHLNFVKCNAALSLTDNKRLRMHTAICVSRMNLYSFKG